MKGTAIIQLIVIGIIVAGSAVSVFCKLLPGLSKRIQSSIAGPLSRSSLSSLSALGLWSQPSDAKAGSCGYGGGCGPCGGCGVTRTDSAPNAAVQPLVFHR
ncbi:MAG: DUF6587 family protein, partial [Dokdonella sp.]